MKDMVRITLESSTERSFFNRKGTILSIFYLLNSVKHRKGNSSQLEDRFFLKIKKTLQFQLLPPVSE